MSYTAEFEIEGIAPISQSRLHEEPMLEKEKHDDYDKRTWKSKMHCTDDGSIFIPPMALKMSLDSVAKYLSEKIQGKGNATYTKHFLSGVLCFDPLIVEKDGVPVTTDDVIRDKIHANADGVRGSGKRVWRRFPTVLPPWTAKGRLLITDHIIEPDLLERYLSEAGAFIGIGRFRPANGGYYGRFKVVRFKAIGA